MSSYVRNFLAIHFYVDDWWMKFDFMAVVPHITGRLASLVSILQRKALTTASASAVPVCLMGVFLYRLSTPWVKLSGCEGLLFYFGDVVFGHAEGPIGLPAQSA